MNIILVVPRAKTFGPGLGFEEFNFPTAGATVSFVMPCSPGRLRVQVGPYIEFLCCILESAGDFIRGPGCGSGSARGGHTGPPRQRARG